MQYSSFSSFLLSFIDIDLGIARPPSMVETHATADYCNAS